MNQDIIDDNKKVEYEHDEILHEEHHGSLTMALTFIAAGLLFMIGTLVDMRVMNFWPVVFIGTVIGVIISVVIRIKKKHK
jgi:hypothetical protein